MPIYRSISKLPYLLISCLLIAGCSVTGPADDGWENSQEWVDNGRLLSEQTKIVYSDKDSENKRSSQAGDPDYDAYQQWREAKQSNSAEYQKFQQWREFEAFQRWQRQQNQSD